MPGTSAGGVKAAATNKQKYGKDYYSKIGRKGGTLSRGGGFATMSKEKVSAAGRKGGSVSRPRKRDELPYPVLKGSDDHTYIPMRFKNYPDDYL